ncbi:NB-ARC domain-containing protein [Plantactinospora mayteni]|uniref:AAA+ ATPase domain-containing protein n=1 Tax=Plantactinospora mayteni TaxID=566021 RepID=A0ABQ4EZP1_9ACTN|nr:NB-ARC domain-containing protein [Plantactinospora mayteni]GIH00144.1 hypothetical protein Pma05_67160 [Plantactinospora mayteni]
MPTLLGSWPAVVKIVAAAGVGAFLMFLVLALSRRQRAATPPVAVVPGGLERIADRDRQHPVVPAELPPPGLLIGRDEALDRMRDHLARPTDDTPGPQLIVLHGKPGVGKTALAVHLAHRVAAEYPDGQLLFRFDPSDGRTVEEQLDGFVWALLNGPKDVKPEPADYQRWYHERTLRRQVLVILDDVENADQILPLLPAGRQCLTIVTAEHDLPELRDRFPHLLSLPVAPLDTEAATQLLHQLVGGDRVSHDSEPARLIVAASGGYPVALSIAGAVLAGRRNWTLDIAVRRMRESAPDRVAKSDLPFRGILDLAYALLTRAEQNALLLLGLAGRRQVQPWLLAAMLRGQQSAGQQPVGQQAAGQQLAGQQAAGQADRPSEPGTEQQQPGLAARLLDRLALARFADRQVDDESGVSTYTLPHYTRVYAAERMRTALPATTRASVLRALQAERVGRHARDVQRLLGQTVYQQFDEGRLNEALESARELLAWCREDTTGTVSAADENAARVREGLVHVALGEVVAEFGWIDAAAAYAANASELSSYPLVRARALRLSGHLRLTQRQFAEAGADLDGALAAVRQTDDDGERLRVLREQIMSQALQGNCAQGRAYAKQAGELCDRRGGAALRERPGILLAEAMVEQLCGDPEKARSLLTEAEQLTADPEAHQQLRCCWIRLQHAMLLLQIEKFDQSREFSLTALAGFTSLRHRYGAGHARLALGRAYLAEQNLLRAIPLLEESHGTLRRCGDRWIMTESATTLAEAYHLDGRVQEASSLLRAARQAYTKVGDTYGQWLTARLLWEVESKERTGGEGQGSRVGAVIRRRPARTVRPAVLTVGTR